ncbi:MAG: rhodanese-like domain-containing protein [Chloroflexi bacterium]|nr:rhodanese-like domain-containing protein [Chloroflexota bacterium]
MNILRTLFGGVKEISPEKYHQAYETQEHILLDVRNPSEFTAEHIDGAVNIPLNKLQKKLKTLPQDRPIICVSRSGDRGREATDLLHHAGYNAANLAGGILAWRKAGERLVH